MHIILAIVTSVDGKSTRGDQSPKDWASQEDQKYFSSLLKKYNLIVIGKNTYFINKSTIKPSRDKLRIVLTRSPKNFVSDTIPGQLEFTDESPRELVLRLEKSAYKEMLLVSGPSLNTAFFKEKLVNELWLTIEPKIFGAGKGLVDQIPLDVNLKLKFIKKLNNQGTLLLKYDVL